MTASKVSKTCVCMAMVAQGVVDGVSVWSADENCNCLDQGSECSGGKEKVTHDRGLISEEPRQ